MSNPGNTGQRYKMSKLASIEVSGAQICHTLDCGHSFVATWDNPEQAERVAGFVRERIGKRQRCNECEAEV